MGFLASGKRRTKERSVVRLSKPSDLLCLVEALLTFSFFTKRESLNFFLVLFCNLVAAFIKSSSAFVTVFLEDFFFFLLTFLLGGGRSKGSSSPTPYFLANASTALFYVCTPGNKVDTNGVALALAGAGSNATRRTFLTG